MVRVVRRVRESADTLAANYAPLPPRLWWNTPSGLALMFSCLPTIPAQADPFTSSCLHLPTRPRSRFLGICAVLQVYGLIFLFKYVSSHRLSSTLFAELQRSSLGP